jgi:hypothetical protein
MFINRLFGVSLDRILAVWINNKYILMVMLHLMYLAFVFEPLVRGAITADKALKSVHEMIILCA